jgi:hypothetical protein
MRRLLVMFLSCVVRPAMATYWGDLILTRLNLASHTTKPSALFSRNTKGRVS